MPFENTQFTYPNFCLGPQSGTFCSVDQSEVSTKLLIKNETGALINSLALSSNIINEVLCIEYVGPYNLSSLLDNLVFFTVEKVNVNSVLIKKWETGVNNSTLNLKRQILKTSTGNYRYDINSACIERYERTFSNHNQAGINYLEVNDLSHITPGMDLVLGPSTDADNIGAVETVTVSYISENKVYLLSNIVYQYIIGNSITFYNNIYLFGNVGYAGDVNKGTIFQINLFSGVLTNTVFDGIYKNVTTSRWSNYMSAIGAVINNSMLFIDPYNYYVNSRSINLNNFTEDKNTLIPVESVVFKDSVFYKLMKKITKRLDDGDAITFLWDNYNYWPDTLNPYTNCLQLFLESSILIGVSETVDIHIKVTDQYGVGLLGVDVDVSKSGTSLDILAYFTPLDGKTVTDSSGCAVVQYTSGINFTGVCSISAIASGGSIDNGNIYVYETLNLLSLVEANNSGSVFQKFVNGNFSSYSQCMRQINSEYNIVNAIRCKTYFTNPGGDWFNPNTNLYYSALEYLPFLKIGFEDGPPDNFGGEWGPGPDYSNRSLLIKQVLNFNSNKSLCQFKDFSGYNDRLRQISDASFEMYVDQLKLVHHTNWVGGVAFSELLTNVSVNQFIFVEDAVPKFWSYKNQKETDIWLRLRPFAFDLNPSTLKVYVREVSYEGDTDYINMTSFLIVDYFDAGSGLEGLDITCPISKDFHHNSKVYVKVEVYDTAPSPNFIWVYYWFNIIPDYRFPFLENLNPMRGQENVPVDSIVSFEVKDDGVGVDIDTFEMQINSLVVTPTITKINDHYFKVNYLPTVPFSFDKMMIVNVKVSDSSENRNYLNDSYRFYTPKSSDVWFADVHPKKCSRGVSPFSSVNFLILGGGNGIDEDTIKVQISELNRTNEVSIVPVIYRLQ